MAKKTKAPAMPTAKALWDAAYPAIEAAGKSVADSANDAKQIVQDGAAEIRNAIDLLESRQITPGDFKAIVESWRQAAQSATARAASEIARNTVAHMKNIVAGAIGALFK